MQSIQYKLEPWKMHVYGAFMRYLRICDIQGWQVVSYCSHVQKIVRGVTQFALPTIWLPTPLLTSTATLTPKFATCFWSYPLVFFHLVSSLLPLPLHKLSNSRSVFSYPRYWDNISWQFVFWIDAKLGGHCPYLNCSLSSHIISDTSKGNPMHCFVVRTLHLGREM